MQHLCEVILVGGRKRCRSFARAGGWRPNNCCRLWLVRIVGGQCDGQLFLDGRIADAGLGTTLVAKFYVYFGAVGGTARQWYPRQYLVMKYLYIAKEFVMFDFALRYFNCTGCYAFAIYYLYTEFVAVEVVAFCNGPAYQQRGGGLGKDVSLEGDIRVKKFIIAGAQTEIVIERIERLQCCLFAAAGWRCCRRHIELCQLRVWRVAHPDVGTALRDCF